jgi:hypothetical protein
VEIGAGESFGLRREELGIDAGVGLPGEEHLEDRRTRRAVGRRHEDHAVEPARTAQRVVDVPRSVRRREHEHALVRRAHPVELGEELVDELADRRRADVASLRTEGVDLVEEQHARRRAARPLEGVMQLLLAFTEVHPEHLVDADRDELGVDLAGRRTGEIRLAAPGRAVEEDPAAGLLAVRAEELRLGERVDDLHTDLVLQLFHAADVGERDRRLRRGGTRGPGNELLELLLGPVGIERDRDREGVVDEREHRRELGVGQHRIERDRTGVALPCGVHLAALEEDPCEEEVRRRRLAPVEEILGEDERLGELSRGEEHAREPQPGGLAAAPGDRLAVLGLCLREPVRREERRREVLPEGEVVGRVLERPTQRVDRVLRAHPATPRGNASWCPPRLDRTSPVGAGQ